MAERVRETAPPSGEIAVERVSREDREMAEEAREIKSFRPDDVERRSLVMYHLNGDGTFTPTAGEMPPGCRNIQEALSYWGFESAGGVNAGTSWIDTMRLPLGSTKTPEYSEVLGGGRALALLHWEDGSESVITLDGEPDIRRAHDAFGNMSRGKGGLDATFDADRNPL